MKLLIVFPDRQFTINELSAGSAVWLAMNRRRMTPDMVRAEFPNAVESPITVNGLKATGVIVDDYQ